MTPDYQINDWTGRMWFYSSTLAMLAALASPSLLLGQVMPATDPTTETVPAPQATWPPLDLAAIEQIALERNPTLVQAGAQVQISRGKALQAGLYPNPNLGYAADQIGAEGTAGEFHGMFVEQQVITGGKLRLSRAKFMQEASQAQLQVLAQRHRVLYSVRIAYYKALVQQRRNQLQNQLLRTSEEAAKTIKELVNVGQANRADLLQAEVQLLKAKANYQVAERRYRGAWEELAALAGVPDMQPTFLDGSLELDSGNGIDREAALANMLTGSPQLRFAEAEVVRDQIALRREQVEPIPNLNLRAETGYNYAAQDTVASIEIGIRVPLFDKNQGTIMQARAELTRAQAEVGRVELMLRQRFAQAFTEYETAMLLATAYRADALPKAEQVYQLYVEAFQQRRAAWPQVLDAQREYYELYEEYLDNLVEARRAEARINAFFLEDGLSQPPAPSPEGHRDATPRPR
jgi:cobalt-zinc-cadmium efflux system outer membrane protein